MKRARLLSTTLSRVAASRLRNATRLSAMRIALVGMILAGLVTMALLYVTRPSYAAACNSTGGGNWNLAGRWSCGHVPTSADDVSILTGHTITYDLASSTILSLTTAGTGALNFNSNSNDSLTVTGSVTNGGTIASVSAAGTRVHTLNVGGDFANNGTFTSLGGDDVLNVVLNGTAAQALGGSSTTTFNSLTISNSSATVSASPTTNIFNVNGTMSIGAGATFSPSATVVINSAAAAGTISGSGTIQVTRTAATADYANQYKFSTNTLSGLTVDYAGAGAQTINIFTYGNLTTSGSGTKTVSTAAGTFQVNATVTIGSGTTLDETTKTMSITGGTLVVNGTLDFTSSTGLIQSTSGTTTLTMGSSGLIRTVDDNGLGPAANASLIANGGLWTTTSISTNGTVEYNRSLTNGQVVTDRNYNNLTISGATQVKTWTLTTDQTINGNLTINSTAPLTMSGTFTVFVKGNWSNSGTFTKGTETFAFTGSAAQTIGGSSATSFNKLTINNSGSGVTLDTSTDVGASVSSALTLTTDLTVNNTGTTPNFLPDFLDETGVTVANSTGPGDVVGDVRRTDVSGTRLPFGNVNVQIANSGTGTTVDVTLVKAAPGGFASAVLRNYTIETAGSVSGAIVRLRYIEPTPNELNGNTEGSLTLWRAVGSPSATWTNQGVTTRDTGNNWDELTGVGAFSTWTLANNTAAPTMVRLTGFTATTQDDGVMLEWKSGFEANNLGYHVYRYQNGQRTRVTPSLIAGSSLISKHGRDLASGYSYGWFDPQGSMGTQYELQALDLHGDVQTFTPRYTAKQGAHDKSQKARAMLVNEVAGNAPGTTAQNGWAKGMNTAADKKTPQASAQALATQQSIAAQQAVKIRVNQPGWYRITQPQLFANGLSASADARKLQLYADGIEVPIRLSTSNSTLGSGDTLEFYGVGLDALTTDTHTYYLVSGTRNGLRIPTTADKGNGKAKNEILAPDFLYTVESKERLIYLPGLLNGEANNIFGQILSTDPVTQNVSLQNVDAGAGGAQLEVVIQGFTEVAHQVQVQLNGTYVGTINFNGATHKSTTLPINGALLHEGSNVVTMTAAGGDSDLSLVDALRMTYAHSYRADNDSLSFSVGNRAAFVTGFSSAAIRVIDVTNPGAVQELSPKITQSNGSYGFTLPAASTVQNLVAFVDNQARQPSAMVANQPSTLNAGTNAADLVIVTHGDFRSSADTLAAARRAQGMKVSVVDVEDVYDEFSFGAHTPQSLRDFFAWSNTHWATGPKYALLFGDSSWDPRNFMGQGFSDYVPTKLVDTVEFETASDDWLTDFNGDGVPEIAMGRLPVRTTADANTMVSKILNYDQERNGGAALRGALLVSDGGFEDQTAQVQSYLSPITTVQTLNRSAIGDDNAMRTQIVNAIDAGPAIVNYFGHGSVGVWTGAGLLNQDNAATLTNGNRVTLFVMMTCLNGYSHDAFIDSLAETLLRDPQGGAFAVWASSGATEPVGQAQMNTQLYQSLLGNQPMMLGDAVRQAKMSTSDSDVRRTWILLGDPTMRLK